MVFYRYSSYNLCLVGKVADSGSSEPVSAPDPEQETETVVSVDQISDQLELTNHLLSSMVFIIGIVAGLLCMFIFWSRFRKM